MKRRTFCASTLWPLALLASRHVSAKDDYPSRPIHLIQPYSAGGSSDVVLRPVANKLGATLGQSVIIDYRPGASTIIGTQLLAKAAPDGYTIGLVTDSQALNPLLFKSLPYDSFADFAFVSQLVGLPMVLVINPSLGIKTIPELVKYAKANPGKLAFGSLGPGPHQLLMAWFNSLAGLDMLHVPFPGTAPAITSVMGNHVQLMFVGPGFALQHVKNKTLNALAVTTSSRLAIAPELPTFVESGFPSYDYSAWYGIAAPAKTPPEIVKKLSQEIGRALRSPDLQETILSQGFIPAPSTPEEFTATLHRTAAFYERLTKIANLKAE